MSIVESLVKKALELSLTNLICVPHGSRTLTNSSYPAMGVPFHLIIQLF